ncbi:MAG: phage capsid protein [Cyanobacteria bacterium SIG26]|nr:phage capsid protein [Cyanobacteria bacterium SIG26]
MPNVVGETYLTLKDKLAQTENGKITSTVIDLLSNTSSVLEDAVVVECNSGHHHKTTVRNGLPEAEFRKYYGGVSCSKGEYTQVTDATGMLEVYSEVDKSLADLNGDVNQFRLNESQGFLEAMNQTVEENIFYGNKDTNPAGFDGLANRYNKISTADDKTIGNFVIDAGGQGDENTSIYFVTWGNLHTHLIYPKGSKAGLQHEDKGPQTKQLPDGKMYEVYRSHYKWDVGLTVRDYRSTARIANIDVANLNATDLIDKMVDAWAAIEDYAKTGKTVIYCNRKVRTALHKQAMNKTNVHLSISEYAGKPVVEFLGIPIKTCNKILNTEDIVPKVA